jgi:hypothetical protein
MTKEGFPIKVTQGRKGYKRMLSISITRNCHRQQYKSEEEEQEEQEEQEEL